MATKPMKLRCTITLENDHTFTVHSKMYDGTPFKLTVAEYDCKLNEDFLPSKRTVTGWIYVDQVSQQHDQVYITLPKPTVEHGHHLLVSSNDLMPRYVSIEDFNPKVETSASVQSVPDKKKRKKKASEPQEEVKADESIEMVVESKSDVDVDLDL